MGLRESQMELGRSNLLVTNLFLIVQGQRAANGIQCELHLIIAHLYIPLYFRTTSVVYIYGFVHCHPSYLIRGGQQIVPSPPPTQPSSSSDICSSPQPQAPPTSKMDCSCGCLARMEPMLETCVLSEALVLNHKQRHSALCSLLYSPSIGFRAPFVHKMTQDDVSDAWVCICAYFFIYSLIFFS